MKTTINRQAVLTIFLTIIFLLSSTIVFNPGKVFASAVKTPELIYGEKRNYFLFDSKFYSFVRITSDDTLTAGDRNFVGARLTRLLSEPEEDYIDFDYLTNNRNNTNKLSLLVSSSEDISHILEFIVGTSTATTEDVEFYDLSEDGKINVLDALICAYQQTTLPFDNDTTLNWLNFLSFFEFVDDNTYEFEIKNDLTDPGRCVLVWEKYFSDLETTETTTTTISESEPNVDIILPQREDLYDPYGYMIHMDYYDGAVQTAKTLELDYYKIVYSLEPIEYGLAQPCYDLLKDYNLGWFTYYQYCPISDVEYLIPDYTPSESETLIFWRPIWEIDEGIDTGVYNDIRYHIYEELDYTFSNWWIIPCELDPETGEVVEVYKLLYPFK